MTTMKVVHIIPGSGDQFYCENCVRDGGLIRALRRHGIDAVAAPLYLPVMEENADLVEDTPVFYGAVNLYLAERYAWWRLTPLWWRKALDSMNVLRFAAKRAGSTRATGLDELTISMLRGESGRQADELDTLVDWLRAEGAPDVIHISNALLLGLAERLRRELHVPIVCSLQDEDVWVDAMPPASARRIWDLIADRARFVDGFVAVSDFYARKISPILSLPPGKLNVIPIGIDLSDYPDAPASSPERPTIGYLSRLHKDHGLDILVESFLELRRVPQLEDTRMVIMGGMTPDDESFVDGLKQRLLAAGASEAVSFEADFSRRRRMELWPRLTLMSVPMIAGEAFGTYQIEAMAGGVPVVQPRVGAFPEIIGNTGGGVCFEPTTAPALAAAIRPLLLDPDFARELGQRGREGVKKHYDLRQLTSQWIELYGRMAREAVSA